MKRNRPDHKSLVPRIHEVKNHGNTKFQFRVHTDYDQRLWPPLGKTYEKTIEETLHQVGKKTVRK